MQLLDHLDTEADLDACLSAPSAADIAWCRRLDGDVLVLGAAGKMGPSLVQRIARALVAAGVRHQVIAASRFSTPSSRQILDEAGATTIAVDLLNQSSVDALPDYVARRFATSRIVAFSTGNVYPFVPVSSRGSVESDAVAPRGEYAQSCLGRERVFEYFSREHGTPTLMFRLNYAVDLRYGVLVDIAQAVKDGRPVDRTVSHFNAIWQGDANSYALRALDGCASPPRVLNVTGAETLSVTDVAEFFGSRFGKRPEFRGQPAGEALLSDARACHEWLGPPTVSASELMNAVALWLERGGRTLDKPTHFETADGKF
jgi:nucleoside-diphosphate-sugar epimerase